ncbi:hypothetical protein RI367_003811 [Sorochytrium milnesiophthora]
MSSPNTFLIETLPSNSAHGTQPPTFYPGSRVAGFVHLHTSDVTAARAVRIQFSGFVETRVPHTVTEPANHTADPITIGDGSSSCSANPHHNCSTSPTGANTVTYTKTHTASATIFQNQTTLWGNPSTGILVAASDLSPGKHAYPFEFTVPLNVPPSFDSCENYGSIRYVLRAWVDRPFRTDFITEAPVFLQSPLDWHLAQSHLHLTSKEHEKTVCCWLWSKGNVHTTLTVPRAVFTFGETIPIHLAFENYSRRRVTHITVRLLRTESYQATQHTHVCNRILAVQRVPGIVGKREPLVQFDTAISLASAMVGITPTISNGINIKVDYALQVTAKVAKACPIQFNFPILVGLLPAGLPIAGLPSMPQMPQLDKKDAYVYTPYPQDTSTAPGSSSSMSGAPLLEQRPPGNHPYLGSEPHLQHHDAPPPMYTPVHDHQP